MSYSRQVQRRQRWEGAREIRRQAVRGARREAQARRQPQLSAGMLVSQWFKLIKGGRRDQAEA